MSNIKIFTIITGNLKHDGITITQKELIKNFKIDDYDYFLVANEKSDKNIVHDFINLGCKIVLLPDRKSNPIKYFFSLIKVLKDYRPDVVHVHGSSSIMFIELLAAKLAGVNVRIAHSRNTRSNYSKLDRVFRPLFNSLYTHALACGDDAGNWLFGNRKFEVIHNGKDFTKFKYNDSIRNSMRIQENVGNKIIIGHVGAFNYQKNHEFIIKVFYEFNKKHNNSILYLIGDGKNKDKIENIAVELGIIEQIKFVGIVENIQDYLQLMDVMIFPSRFEGLPNVVLEWQAMGLPCIISDKITKECIVSNLVESVSINIDPKVWADKIEQILSNFTDRISQSNEGIKGLRRNGFDVSDTAIQLDEIYRKAVRKS